MKVVLSVFAYWTVRGIEARETVESLASLTENSEEPSIFSSPFQFFPPKKATYGPGECVSVWKDSSSGSCMLETSCHLATGFELYDMGFLCGGETNATTVMHLYGKASFAREEIFDTKEKCYECLPLEDAQMDTIGKITSLVGEVKLVKKKLADINKYMSSLSKKADQAGLLDEAPAPAPAPEEAPAAAVSVSPASDEDAAAPIAAQAAAPMSDDEALASAPVAAQAEGPTADTVALVATPKKTKALSVLQLHHRHHRRHHRRQLRGGSRTRRKIFR
jgi:hypothetical protein